jgi:hypothetical protein
VADPCGSRSGCTAAQEGACAAGCATARRRGQGCKSSSRPTNRDPTGRIKVEDRRICLRLGESKSRSANRARAITVGEGGGPSDDCRGASAGKREAAPLGGGRGEPANYRVGAPFSTRRRRGRRGAFGWLAKIGVRVGGLLEHVFFLLSDPTF